tara:strand:+ start:119 stop:814 length:696 start_codon:yes stop_codon:yes gene_type:complete
MLLRLAKRSMSTIAAAQKALKTSTCVAFDVDSTVTMGEGLDDLAEFCGKGEEVAALTNQAMGGSMPFEVALAKRLDIVKPSLAQVTEFLATEPPVLTTGIAELIAELHRKNKKVYLVSGGFRQLIYPVADMVGVSHEHVYANNLLFNEDGSYAGFDDTELTAWSGGKARVMEELQKAHGDPIVMVGDGATDVEARPPATAVIGFGGNVERESVVRDADWFVYDFDKMVEAL